MFASRWIGLGRL